MCQDQIPNPITAAARFQIEQGLEIGRRARALYPTGHLIATHNFNSAIAAIQNLMIHPNTQTLFEPAFLTENIATRADILTRKQDGRWHLIEVKARIVDFKPVCIELEELTRTPKKPEPELRFECRGCDLFKDCTGQGIDNHIFDLPRLNQTRFETLTDSGIVCIEEIPSGFSLTGKQNRVKVCVQSNKPQIEARLKPDLEAVSWPTFYLDFETVMTAIPLYPNLAPYAQLPTQYSIHKCSEPGHVTAHSEYLADPSRDCRLELAERLISDLKGAGSIVVYTSFEKTIINGLARLYPDLAADLNLLIGRLVDLEAIIKKNFYHPGFHGRTSIKRTLPVLVPEMSYDGLDIGMALPRSRFLR
ncbi:MAG: DUF2779 domain-containing protein [Methanophagales archaeon]|nr:DUF2779 domain-containing protein [Methanophagales archaeon]